MKKLSKSLNLNKKSIQILDSNALVDLRGGAALSDQSCDQNSCNSTCRYDSCGDTCVAL